MPEWLQLLIGRMGVTLPGWSWEQTFTEFASTEQQVHHLHQRITAVGQVLPVPMHVVAAYNVFRENVYQTQKKLRGAAIRAGGVQANAIPKPARAPALRVRVAALRAPASGEGLGGVAVPMTRISQLGRSVPGTVGALGALSGARGAGFGVGPAGVFIAGAVIALAAMGIVAAIWWRGVAATEAVARVVVTKQQGLNLTNAVDSLIQCIEAAGSNEAAIGACASVVGVPTGQSPATELPAPGDSDPLAGLERVIKGLVTLTVIGGIVYGGVVIVQRLRRS